MFNLLCVIQVNPLLLKWSKIEKIIEILESLMITRLFILTQQSCSKSTITIREEEITTNNLPRNEK